MRVYTVHLPPFSNRDRDPVLIKEGYCWTAFLFGPLWSIAHRLWLVTVGLLAFMVVMSAAMEGFALDPVTQGILSFAVTVLIGAHGNDLRRHGLARRGWRETGVIAARNYDEALARYLNTAPHERASVPRVRANPVPPPPIPIAGL